jgi:hypothetical protein
LVSLAFDRLNSRQNFASMIFSQYFYLFILAADSDKEESLGRNEWAHVEDERIGWMRLTLVAVQLPAMVIHQGDLDNSAGRIQASHVGEKENRLARDWPGMRLRREYRDLQYFW